MKAWPVMAVLVAVSVAFFIAAAVADTYDQAFFLAMLGAAAPAAGAIALKLWSMGRWRSMASELGLVAGAGAYPDLEGRYKGRRLIILRRTNPYGGPRQTTTIRLEGHPELRVPGIVTDAAAVKSLLAPFLDP